MKNHTIIHRRTVHLSIMLPLLLMLAYSTACTGSGGGAAPEPTPDKRPEITDDTIRQTIDDARVRDVPEESNAAEPINWSFDSDEPKEFTVLERSVEGDNATFVIDMKTRSSPGARNPRQLWGKIKLHYALRTEFILRKWRIIKVENISMKYRNEPKPDDKSENK